MKKGRKRDYGRLRGDSGQRRRLRIIAALLGIVAFVPVAIRLYSLMILDYSYYQQKAQNNQTRQTAVSPRRGRIYDCNMNILAATQSTVEVYLNPRQLRDQGVDMQQLSQQLGQLLQKDPQWIWEKAQDMSLRYQRIASGLEEQQAAALRSYLSSENITGVHLQPGNRRYYPYGELAAQVIGFVNASGAGSEGIEAAYNSYLQGKTGRVISGTGNHETDMPYSYEAYVAAEGGCDVILTLDTTVQACLEQQLEAAVARYDVQGGAFGMVMQADTGQILAMATLGSYDPNCYLEITDSALSHQLKELKNAYQQHPEGSAAYEQGEKEYRRALESAQLKQWRNRCICDGYEPGSTFKLLTLSAALDCGAVTLEDHFSCSGAAHIPGRSQLLHCWRASGHGSQTTGEALQNSCNLAFANIALRLGGERFYQYVQAFGIMEKTGIDLLGESKGIFFDRELITNTEKWGTASLTSGSFGQTFKLTPLQLVRAVAAVVNGGYLVEPYVVQEILDSRGNTVLYQEPTVLRQVISGETSKTMCRLMESVVTSGTAKNAQVAGYRIGGKTGTSEKIDVLDENGKPTLDKIVSFVGVAPMDDPEYIVLVALDTPSRSTGLYISGGVMAAPTVGAVMADILPYLGVSSTAAPEQTVPDLVGLTMEQAAGLLKAAGLTARTLGQQERITNQLPAAGTAVPQGSEMLLYFGAYPQQRMVTVPDFTGMTRQQAVAEAGKVGIYIRAQGNSRLLPTVVVTAQSHPKATQVPAGTTMTLTFADTSVQD